MILALGAAPGLGQSQLPDAVRSAQPLSASDQTMVAGFVQQALADLASSDASEAQGARDRLSAPVLGPTSVSFRIYYSQQVMPRLESMLSPNVDPHQAQLILTVAGAVSTDASLALLINAMDDDRAAIRFGAARELGVLLGQVDRGQAITQQDRVARMITTLRQTLVAEPDLFVASEIAKALVTPVLTQTLVDQGLESMCLAMADRLDAQRDGATPSEQVAAILRAVKDARDRLIARQIEGKTPKSLDDAAARFASAARAFSVAIAGDASLDDDSATLNSRLQIAANSLRQLATGLN